MSLDLNQDYRELVESAGNSILVADEKGVILNVNESTCRFFGYSREELVGKSCIGLIVPGGDSPGADAGQHLLEMLEDPEEHPWSIEENVKKEGERVWMLWTNHRVGEGGGRVIRIGSDITELKKAQETASESEAKYRAVVDLSPTGILVISDGVYVFANPAAVRILGAKSADDIVGKDALTFTHPDFHNLARQRIRSTLEGKEPNPTVEIKFVRMDGETVPIEAVSMPFLYSGRPSTLLIVQDIGDRKKAEAELRAMASLPEENPAPVLRITADGAIAYSNGPARALLREWGTDIGHAAPISWQQTVGEALASGKTKVISVEHEGIHYAISVVPVGGLDYVNLYAADITEMKMATEAMRRSEERFRTAFENAVSGMTMVDPQDNFLQVNDAFCRMLGYSRDEVLALGFRKLTYPDDLEENLRLSRMLYAGEISSFQLEKRYVHRDGHPVWTQVSISAIRNAKGETVHTISQVQDITARKVLEADLREREGRLERMVDERTRELEETHRRLLQSEKMATVGQISTQVAHDLRNPLTALNTDLYVLEETLSKSRRKKLKETLGSMQASVTHSNKIVTDLLEFSGGGEVKSVSLLLDGVIRDSVAAAHVPRGIKVEIGGSGEAHMSGDPTRLMKMFSNVLRNSIEAMPSGGRVIISIKVLRRRAQVFIRDEGVGMRREELSKLFTPYFTTKATGLGLGLAIAKQVAEAHGGTIDVRSRIGEGTTVRITLPLSRRPGRPHSEEPSRASPSSPPSSPE